MNKLLESVLLQRDLRTNKKVAQAAVSNVAEVYGPW